MNRSFFQPFRVLLPFPTPVCAQVPRAPVHPRLASTGVEDLPSLPMIGGGAVGLWHLHRCITNDRKPDMSCQIACIRVLGYVRSLLLLWRDTKTCGSVCSSLVLWKDTRTWDSASLRKEIRTGEFWHRYQTGSWNQYILFFIFL